MPPALMPRSDANRRIPAGDRLIVALDVDGAGKALALVRALKSRVRLFKVGLELFFAEGWGVVERIVEAGREEGVQVFLDLKLLDIPETVRRALRRLEARSGQVAFVTLHGLNWSGERPARIGAQGSLRVLAVTVLTSTSQRDLAAAGIGMPLEEYVTFLADRALRAGADGLIASGREVRHLRQRFGSEPILVTPGIRPAWATVRRDDQARVVTPRQAILDGADYLVVGRPVRDHPRPVEAAAAIIREIEEVLVERGGNGPPAPAAGPGDKTLASV